MHPISNSVRDKKEELEDQMIADGILSSAIPRAKVFLKEEGGGPATLLPLPN